MRNLGLIVLTTMILSTHNVGAQIADAELSELKILLEGNWKHKKKLTTFSFHTDTSGMWEIENIITTAPLFVIYKEETKWYLGSIDLLGNGEPYPFEIITLNNKKLIIKNKTKGSLIKYNRVQD